MKQFDLDGHVGLVTGGNGGIGLGLATGLAKAGAKVVIWGRNVQKLEAAKAELEEHGGEVAAFECDVSDEEAVIAATARSLDRFGRIDSCFANAGYTIPRSFLKLSRADWDEVLATNLTGAFLTFREVLRHMVERGGGGKLIGLSSIGTLHGMPGQEAYAVTKAGMVALVRSIAVEFARHDVQAHVLTPGWIHTAATAPAREMPKLYETVTHRTPARRWGEVEDFEGVAVYLASSASKFQTGDIVTVDGGYTVF